MIDLLEAQAYLATLVPQAGEALRRHFTSGTLLYRQKEGIDFATQADEEVDEFLRENLSRQYPHTSFLTEESAPSDYSSFCNINNLCIIDPLDGTINFCRKNEHFAISVALVNKGVPKLGIVYIPMKHDLYWAQEDKDGAYLNGNPIYVSPTSKMQEAVVACDWSWDLKKRANVLQLLERISSQVRQIKSMGSAVADLANLASGRIDIYIHSGVKPWDVAASALLVEKAGGKITTPSGARWDVFHSDILAVNGNNMLYEKLMDLITKNGKEQ